MPTKGELVESARLAQLQRFAPQVLTGGGTLLYVGASPRRAQFLERLMATHRVTLLEIWPANADYFRQKGPGLEVVCGDVRQVAKLALPVDRYDVAFWWHGPEHIRDSELAAALAGLEQRARMVVIGCPWGASRQVAIDGNAHQQHVATLYPADLQARGYRVDTIGVVNGGSRSNLLGVKQCPTF
jgi:hypothetical protein